MKQTTFLFHGLLLITICSLFACDFETGQEGPKIEKMIDGDWEVIEARRNGKPTGSLDNGFYRINGNSVSTNLSKNLDSIVTDFKLLKNKLTHSNKEALDFDVSKMTADTLILETEIKSFKFEILLMPSSE